MCAWCAGGPAPPPLQLPTAQLRAWLLTEAVGAADAVLQRGGAEAEEGGRRRTRRVAPCERPFLPKPLISQVQKVATLWVKKGQQREMDSLQQNTAVDRGMTPYN